MSIEELELRLKNETLQKENERLLRVITRKSQHLKRISSHLRGSRVLVTKLRKKLLDTESKPKHSFVLKETFVSKKGDSSPTSTRTSEFISKIRFMQHTCLLSFQKASLIIDLCFDLFFGCAPPPKFVPSPATIASWNLYLGEVDKIHLRESFKDSPYEAHIWADDSTKGGSDRHVVGIHTWNKLTEKPETYILGYSLISSGSGKDQAKADFHVVSKQFGITDVGAMIGDNAKTQTGNKRGLVKMNSQLFDKEMFLVGCYPHVLNIVVRRACQSAFGSKGDMSNIHVQHMHYKIGWVHHAKPEFYQSMYVNLGILEKAPPLPQMWVETRWEYLHNHLEWYSKYESACVNLAKKMVLHLPNSDSHLSVWKDIVKMHSVPLIQVERVFLGEFLKLFIIPTLKKSQANDMEMGFGPGYLARLWPFNVRKHMITMKSFQEFPKKFFPETESKLFNSLKDVDHSNFFRKKHPSTISQGSLSWHYRTWRELARIS